MENLKSYLDRINNITSVTDKLVTDSAEFAVFIINAMDKAGLKSLLNGKLQYRESYFKSDAGGYQDYLYLDTGDYHSENGEAGNLISEVCSNDGSFNLHGDFSVVIKHPNREEILLFNELAPEIIKELASYGDETENNFKTQ